MQKLARNVQIKPSLVCFVLDVVVVGCCCVKPHREITNTSNTHQGYMHYIARPRCGRGYLAVGFFPVLSVLACGFFVILAV